MMSARTLLLTLVFAAAVSLFSTTFAAVPDRMAEAKQWCDSAAVDPLEGIWLFPYDRVYVLARRAAETNVAEYSLTVIAALDGVTETDVVAGYMQRSPDPAKVLLRIPDDMKKKVPDKLRECTLTLTKEADALYFDPHANPVRFSFSPTSFLPGFWKMFRFSFHPSQAAPVRGLVKVYPISDSADRYSPEYL